MQLGWWILIGIIWLVTGYFVVRHLLTLTIKYIYRKKRAYRKPPMTTVEKGGWAFAAFVLMVAWPLVLALNAAYWFFWGLFWVIGKLVGQLPGWRDD
jgi:hypothetical protein